MKQESWRQAIASFKLEAEALEMTADAIGRDDFEKAVGALCGAQRIAASGCGHTGIACAHFAHSMCCIEKPARFIPPSEGVHGASGFIQAGDVIVLASRGGKTAELLPLLRIAKKKKATVIAVTQNLSSPLAAESDIVLPMQLARESDKFDSQGTCSFVALCGVFDALQVALIEETGFEIAQFAISHPGGAVGQRLNELEDA